MGGGGSYQQQHAGGAMDATTCTAVRALYKRDTELWERHCAGLAD